MRQHAHAAAATLPVARFRHARAIVALGDAFIEHAKIFRHRLERLGAFRQRRIELLFLLDVQALNAFFLGMHGRFTLAQIRFRLAHPPLGIFAGHHGGQLAILRGSHLRLRVGDFVLQRLVRFVGFHCRRLVAIFPGAVFPLLDVELDFFAFADVARLQLFGGGQRRFCAGQLGVGFLHAFGKRVQRGAQCGHLVIHAL